MNQALKNDITCAKCDLEELNECGDLEERMAASQKLAELEVILLECEQKGVEATWNSCGLCRGAGFHKEYDETYTCGACGGNGGNW